MLTYLPQTSLEQAEASTCLADERSIGLRKVLDVLLEREQVAEESHVQEVAWFGAQYTFLNSRRANPQGQQSAEQVSTYVEALEQTLEGCKAELRMSEAREQQQLGAIDNLKQDVERVQTDGGALLREKTALELTCVTVQDRVRIIWAKHGQAAGEFETKISDIEVSPRLCALFLK